MTSIVTGAPTHPWEIIAEQTHDGVMAYRLRGWSAFPDFLEQEVYGVHDGERRQYVWRGQRRASWPLNTSLDRLLERAGLLDRNSRQLETWATSHLEQFRYAARGRVPANASDFSDNEWWALGQHFGLATPLLDWTRSPYAGAFFAFDADDPAPTSHRVLWALDRKAVAGFNRQLETGESFEVGRMPRLEFVDPLYGDNPRLVSQGGLFTRAPIGTPVETWVREAFPDSQQAVLLRIEIPDADRGACLRALTRMNISALTLFPDLSGASLYVNRAFELNPPAPRAPTRAPAALSHVPAP